MLFTFNFYQCIIDTINFRNFRVYVEQIYAIGKATRLVLNLPTRMGRGPPKLTTHGGKEIICDPFLFFYCFQNEV